MRIESGQHRTFSLSLESDSFINPPAPKGNPMKRFALVLTAFAALSAPAMADEALAKAKNCMACHAVDKKLVGPAYKDISKKYAGNAAAVAQLATKIQKGGAGVWGAIPMPANPGVNDADAKKLAQWVLSQK
jgi:cytochrome c